MSAASEAVRRVVGYELDHLHTALPGRIESYDAATGRASVLPLLRKRYLDGKVEPLPVIPSVPVVFPRTGAGRLTFKLAKGDGVLLIFAERALERWLSLGGEQEPGQARRHDLTDAIAVPGLYSFADGPLDAQEREARLEAGLASVTLDSGEATLQGTTAAIGDGIARVQVKGGQVAIGVPGVELVDLLVQLTQALASAICIPSSPLSAAPQIAIISAQLQLLKGSLQ